MQHLRPSDANNLIIKVIFWASNNGMYYALTTSMKMILGEYRRKCKMQPLGTKKRAECMKTIAESIILQCVEDLWDKPSMKQSSEFFSRRGFSICAAIAGMDICDQVKLLDLVNRSVLGLKVTPPGKGRRREGWFGHNMRSSPKQASLVLS